MLARIFLNNFFCLTHTENCVSSDEAFCVLRENDGNR
jgi:hypothetical protein